MRVLMKVVGVFFGLAILTVAVVTVHMAVVFVGSNKSENGVVIVGSGGSDLRIGNAIVVESVPTVADSVIGGDARLIAIERYLERYKSPLLPYASRILELSDRYGYEYYWIVAIAQQESNLCKKIPVNSHNCWGYGINSAGTLRFESYDLALDGYAEYLDREYFKKGYTTTESIMSKYCPHSDGSWARGVNQFIAELEASLGV